MFGEAYINLAQEIERVFANIEYPGDESLVNLYHDGIYCLECASLRESFKGRHWRDIPLKVLIWERGSVPLFTPEGYCFYLPAYLRAALLHPLEVDTMTENIVYSLTPPELDGTNMEHFHRTVQGFTPEQKQAIWSFLKLYTETEASSSADPDLVRANRFWEKEIHQI